MTNEERAEMIQDIIRMLKEMEEHDRQAVSSSRSSSSSAGT